MVAVVCVSRDWGIGCGGKLLFRLSADLRRFRTLTEGGTVILGAKTLATFPGGRPLPKRRNIILTHAPGPIEGAERARSPEEAAALAGETAAVIGGESVYRALLGRCGRAYVTKVDAAPPADRFFPDLDADPAWRIERESPPFTEGGLTFRFIDYARR